MTSTRNGNTSFNLSRTDSHGTNAESLVPDYIHLIFPYSLILLLAVVGNLLVIITLAVNKRMRTVTNVFLFNLALSDLLLGVFCMPFTLAGVLLRAFVFGEAMCKMIPYLQAVSVSVGAWTLVAMSLERYYAICHPLKSRQWQTFSHAKRMIGLVWIFSLLAMSPIAVLSELKPMRTPSGVKYKCRESWPSAIWEQIFNLFIDVILLIIPLTIMTVTYSLITFTLWKALKHPVLSGLDGASEDTGRRSPTTTGSHFGHQSVSAVHNQKSLQQKKRVIRMLFVVVLEFFLCWTPLYAINTISLFDPQAVYNGLGYQGISLFQLLAYGSSCCNPITYCFMNSKFRQNFLNIFGCRRTEMDSRGSLANTTYRSDRTLEHRSCRVNT